MSRCFHYSRANDVLGSTAGKWVAPAEEEEEEEGGEEGRSRRPRVAADGNTS